MASAEQMQKLGYAENRANYQSKWNTMGGWKNRMFGSFQMSKGAWTDAGGDASHWGANQANTASYQEQYQVASKYFDMMGDDYPNWNLGKGNANLIRSLGSQPFSAVGIGSAAYKAAHGQAWGNFPDSMPCNQVIQKCLDYYNNGKTTGGTFNGQGANGASNPYAVAGSSNDNLANGTAGGIIILWLEKNTTDPTSMKWHTEKQTHTIDGNTVQNIHELFYVPDNIAYMSADTFAGIHQQDGNASGSITFNNMDGTLANKGEKLNTFKINKASSLTADITGYDTGGGHSVNIKGAKLSNIEGTLITDDFNIQFKMNGTSIHAQTASSQTNGFTANMQLNTDTRTGLPFVASLTNMYMFKPVIFGDKSS